MIPGPCPDALGLPEGLAGPTSEGVRQQAFSVPFEDAMMIDAQVLGDVTWGPKPSDATR